MIRGVHEIPSYHELRDAAHVVSVPLRFPFRGVTVREAMLFEGPAGWGEFSPFLEYGDVEAAQWLAAAIDFGWNDLPALYRQAIGINATVPAVDPDRVGEVLAAFGECRTVKVKVAQRGQVLADDVARVAEVRRIVGAEGRIRVDANGAWNVDEAERAINALAEYDLEYAEQPCLSAGELVEIRARVSHLGVAIAADESVRRADDPLEVARLGAADVLVVKAQPLGGLRRALPMISRAGLPAVISSALETSVGISAGLFLAAAAPAMDSLERDHGLGTVALLAEDVADHPLTPVGGQLPVQRVIPRPDRLDALRPSKDRVQWWHDRLHRCYDAMTVERR